MLGETMARASVRAQAEKIGILGEEIELPKISALLDALGKGMRVFIGARRTRELLDGLIDTLGEEASA